MFHHRQGRIYLWLISRDLWYLGQLMAKVNIRWILISLEFIMVKVRVGFGWGKPSSQLIGIRISNYCSETSLPWYWLSGLKLEKKNTVSAKDRVVDSVSFHWPCVTATFETTVTSKTWFSGLKYMKIGCWSWHYWFNPGDLVSLLLPNKWIMASRKNPPSIKFDL